ncbi:MAG: hypothetical protein KDI51_12340, partial [Xanthomonadales bacterium]|nr:hypothetical protein [Xanthomonadales bacterium]
EQCFGSERSLSALVRSLVGLDRTAAKEAFARFLDQQHYGSQQIRFIEMIIDRLTACGVMDPGLLYEPPFTAVHQDGIDGLFNDGDADAIIGTIREINERAA